MEPFHSDIVLCEYGRGFVCEYNLQVITKSKGFCLCLFSRLCPCVGKRQNDTDQCFKIIKNVIISVKS